MHTYMYVCMFLLCVYVVMLTFYVCSCHNISTKVMFTFSIDTTTKSLGTFKNHKRNKETPYLRKKQVLTAERVLKLQNVILKSGSLHPMQTWNYLSKMTKRTKKKKAFCLFYLPL